MPLNRLSQRIAERLRAAQRLADRAGGANRSRINVASKRNVQIVTNVGRPGSTAQSTARQATPVRQRYDKAAEAARRQEDSHE